MPISSPAPFAAAANHAISKPGTVFADVFEGESCAECANGDHGLPTQTKDFYALAEIAAFDNRSLPSRPPSLP